LVNITLRSQYLQILAQFFVAAPLFILANAPLRPYSPSPSRLRNLLPNNELRPLIAEVRHIAQHDARLGLQRLLKVRYTVEFQAALYGIRGLDVWVGCSD
jgi:hypothetical protein